MPRMSAPGLFALTLFGFVSPVAAETYEIRLAELSGVYRWTTSAYDGSVEGGPVSTTFTLPEDIGTIVSLTVVIGGQFIEGVEHYSGESDGGYDSRTATMPFTVDGPCFIFTRDQPAGYFLAEYVFTECDFSTMPGTEQTVTAWIHEAVESGYSWWNPDPLVEVFYVDLRFEVDRTVDGENRGWSTLKHAWRERE